VTVSPLREVVQQIQLDSVAEAAIVARRNQPGCRRPAANAKKHLDDVFWLCVCRFGPCPVGVSLRFCI